MSFKDLPELEKIPELILQIQRKEDWYPDEARNNYIELHDNLLDYVIKNRIGPDSEYNSLIQTCFNVIERRCGKVWRRIVYKKRQTTA